jgi:hypothetical protein
MLPKLTLFTTGPIAGLLTDAGTYGGNFVFEYEDPTGATRKLSGQILAGKGKLCLLVNFGSVRHQAAAGNFKVVWDATAGQGFVSSDALQGYAPILGAIHFTNALTEVQAGTTDRIDGHPVDQARVTEMTDDGQIVSLEVSRAPDLEQLPLLIHSPYGPDQFTLTLSNVQRFRPADDDFLPPDGFTKFTNAGTLIDELATRLQNVYGGSDDGGEFEGFKQPETPDHPYGNASQVP